MQTDSAARGQYSVESARYPASHKPMDHGFLFHIRQAGSQKGLAYAAFAVYQNQEQVAFVRSDENGKVLFPALRPGQYEWLEISAPHGYLRDAKLHTLHIDRKGVFYVDQRLAGSGEFAIENAHEQHSGCFSALCVDAETLAPVCGAEFALYPIQGKYMLTHTNSTDSGQVSFGPMASGMYALVATVLPEGYMGLSIHYAVTVRENGYVLLGGEPADGFRLFLFRTRAKAMEDEG